MDREKRIRLMRVLLEAQRVCIPQSEDMMDAMQYCMPKTPPGVGDHTLLESKIPFGRIFIPFGRIFKAAKERSGAVEKETSQERDNDAHKAKEFERIMRKRVAHKPMRHAEKSTDDEDLARAIEKTMSTAMTPQAMWRI